MVDDTRDGIDDDDSEESFAVRARRAATEIRDEEAQRSKVIDAAERSADDVIGGAAG